MSDDRRHGTGGLTADERRALWARMRVPVITFVALMILLGVNLAIGWLQPISQAWLIELPVLFVMIATVLLYSMEVLHDPPLIKFFSVLGFCWVAIMFTMTLIDYSTR